MLVSVLVPLAQSFAASGSSSRSSSGSYRSSAPSARPASGGSGSGGRVASSGAAASSGGSRPRFFGSSGGGSSAGTGVRTSSGPGFWTGALVGYMFAGGAHQDRQVVQDIAPELPEDDELYGEYRRNQELLKAAQGADKETLLQRNAQIEKQLADFARSKYRDSFELALEPLSSHVIETQVMPAGTTDLDVMARISAMFGSDPVPQGPEAFSALRKEIVYAVGLSVSSPQPIGDFIVSQNGKELQQQDGHYVLDYQQSFGANNITLELQDRTHAGLHFALTHSYYVQSAADRRDDFRTADCSPGVPVCSLYSNTNLLSAMQPVFIVLGGAFLLIFVARLSGARRG